MDRKINALAGFVLCAGLIVGCSSSNNSPSTGESTNPDTVNPGVTDAGTADAGTADAGTADAGTADAGGGDGTIDLNGDYDLDVMLSEASMVSPECSEVSGTLTVTGTTITGTVDDRFDVTGTIGSDGNITGGFALEDGNAFANYGGMLEGAALAGTWTDITGCAGTWRAEKVAEI